MADSGHRIRSFNAKLARQEHLPQLPQSVPRLTEEEWKELEQYMAACRLADKAKSAIPYAKSKAEEQLFLEDLVEDTTNIFSENKASTSSSAMSTTTPSSKRTRAVTGATVLLTFHREVLLASFRQLTCCNRTAPSA
ncbi:unnamed protein product [Jaminaea pallidilutea]